MIASVRATCVWMGKAEVLPAGRLFAIGTAAGLLLLVPLLAAPTIPGHLLPARPATGRSRQIGAPFVCRTAPIRLMSKTAVW